MCEILIKNVSKSFSDVIPPTNVIDNINLKIKKGEFIAFFGPNGCGKTTLFKLISGLEEPSKGKILIDNKSPNEIKKSFVFQDYRNSIFPWLTVRKNVEFGLALKNIKKENIRKISEHYLKKVNLWSFRDKYPYQLSGGMAQLVSIARAWATEPELLLLDEPFSSLDYQIALQMREELSKIWEEKKKTTIFISHELDEAIFLADRIVVLSPRPAKIEGIVEVNLPRPRKIEVMLTPEFSKIRNKVLKIFRGGLR